MHVSTFKPGTAPPIVASEKPIPMNKTHWHVMLIDDNADDRATVRHMLLEGATRRYRFSEATLGEDALRMLQDAASAWCFRTAAPRPWCRPTRHD